MLYVFNGVPIMPISAFYNTTEKTFRLHKTWLATKKRAESFLSHMGVLISVSLELSQTPPYYVRPLSQSIAECVCLLISFH